MKRNTTGDYVTSTLIITVMLAGATVAAAGQNVNWLSYGNDLANTRFQNVDQINPSNVNTLQVAWVFHTGVLDPLAELEASPIVHDGVMYIVDGHSDVFALDAATGHEVLELFRRLNADGATLVVVTHDETLAAEAGRVVRMLDGRVVAQR